MNAEDKERMSILKRIIEERRLVLEQSGVLRESQSSFEKLRQCYRCATRDDTCDTRLCVFTGAGVSFMKEGQYETPGWMNLLESIHEKIYSHPKHNYPSFARLQEMYKSPWDIAEYLLERTDDRKFIRLIRHEIQKWTGRDIGKKVSRNTFSPYKRLPRSYLNKQTTLNSTIAFCSCLTAIKKYPCYKPNLNKIKAVLTLNYDWYLEGGATTKYQTKLPFKPIARFNPRSFKGKLPVYHIHGYFPYNKDREPRGELILSKSQYENAYNDEEGFLRTQLDFFLTRHPTLFVGISFKDDFLLDRLKSLAEKRPNINQFALFRKRDITNSRVKEIKAAGISPVFFNDFASIPRILGEVYREGLNDTTLNQLFRSHDFLTRDWRDYWALLLYNKK